MTKFDQKKPCNTIEFLTQDNDNANGNKPWKGDHCKDRKNQPWQCVRWLIINHPDDIKLLDKQGRRNVFTTGQAKLDPEDYAIKCVGR